MLCPQLPATAYRTSLHDIVEYRDDDVGCMTIVVAGHRYSLQMTSDDADDVLSDFISCQHEHVMVSQSSTTDIREMSLLPYIA